MGLKFEQALLIAGFHQLVHEASGRDEPRREAALAGGDALGSTRQR